VTHITVYAGARAVEPAACDDLTWSAFGDEIEALCREESPAVDKRDLVAFGPYRLREGATRSADAVDTMSDVVMLDVDHGLNVDALRARIDALGVAAIVHESPTSCVVCESNPTGETKVRIYVQLDAEHAPADAGRVRRAVADILGVTCDPSTVNADRIGFVGRLAGTPERDVLRFDGRPLALAELPDVATTPTTTTTTTTTTTATAATPRPSAAKDAAKWAVLGALGGAQDHDGSKHAVCGALGGMLRKAGWNVDDAADVVRAWVSSHPLAGTPAVDVEAGVAWATKAWLRPSEDVSGRQALDRTVGADVASVIEQATLLPWRARAGVRDVPADDAPADGYATLRRVDLASDPPPLRYVVPGLEFAPGKVSAMQGFANAGKTPLALLFATCVSTGEAFLGMPVARCPVLYLDHESSPLTHERAVRIRVGLGIASTPDLHLYKADPMSDAWLDDVERLVAAEGIGAIVVDTYSSALPDDAGSFNDSTFRAWANRLGALSDRADVLVVVLVHDGKTEGRGLRGISGHGSFAGALQAAVSLEATDESDLIVVRSTRAIRKPFTPFAVRWTDPPDPAAPTGASLVATREDAPAAKPGRAAGASADKFARTAKAVRAAGTAIMRDAARNRASSRRELQRISGETNTIANAALTRLVAAEMLSLTPPDAYAFTDEGRAADDTAVAAALGLTACGQR